MPIPEKRGKKGEVDGKLVRIYNTMVQITPRASLCKAVRYGYVGRPENGKKTEANH